MEKKIDFSFNLLNSLKNKDYQLELCSASLDIIINTIGSELNLKSNSSSLEFQNNICTGKIKKDLLGNKHISIPKSENIYMVVTDNTSDYKLLLRSQKTVIISNKKNLSFWKKRNLNVNHII